MRDLARARALVTGGSGGLGRAIARGLHARGASVVVTGRRADALEAVASEVGGRAVVADLSRREELGRLIAEAGDLDIAILNAGLPATGQLEEWTQDQIDQVLEVNLASPIALTRALLPALRARGSGHLVYVSSMSGKVPSPGAPLYSATKFALRGFAGSLRSDLRGTGVGCSVVFPGFVSDQGLFADSGVELPRGVGSVTSDQVVTAVLRAITLDRGEVDVAPLNMLLGARVASLAPDLSMRVQRLLGGRLAEAMVEAQRRYRP